MLGVGDALVGFALACCLFMVINSHEQASIIGKRYGLHRWSPTTNKTLEGSFAFTLSVVVSAWVLRLFSLTESFSVSVWLCVVFCGLTISLYKDSSVHCSDWYVFDIRSLVRPKRQCHFTPVLVVPLGFSWDNIVVHDLEFVSSFITYL